MADLTVIIPVKKGEFYIEECLKAVAANEEIHLHIYAILDGWDCLSFRKSCEKIHPQLQVFSLPKSSPAACRNFGATQATTDFICFVDSDVLVPKNLFAQALHRLNTSGDAGLIGSYDTEPRSNRSISRFRNVFHHFHHQLNNGNTGVFWGAFGMIRQKVFHTVGGFDETFTKASIEDVELGIRLAQQGYKVSIHADLEVKHLKNWTLYTWMTTDILLRAKPWTKLIFHTRSYALNHLNTKNQEKLTALVAFLLWISIGGVAISPYFWYVIPCLGFLFLVCQRKFYVFALRNFRNIAVIFFLHQVYFFFAFIGFTLGLVAFSFESVFKTHQKSPIKG